MILPVPENINSKQELFFRLFVQALKCLTCKSDAKKNIYECGTLHDGVPHTRKKLGYVSF